MRNTMAEFSRRLVDLMEHDHATRQKQIEYNNNKDLTREARARLIEVYDKQTAPVRAAKVAAIDSTAKALQNKYAEYRKSKSIPLTDPAFSAALAIVGASDGNMDPEVLAGIENQFTDNRAALLAIKGVADTKKKDGNVSAMLGRQIEKLDDLDAFFSDLDVNAAQATYEGGTISGCSMLDLRTGLARAAHTLGYNDVLSEPSEAVQFVALRGAFGIEDTDV